MKKGNNHGHHEQKVDSTVVEDTAAGATENTSDQQTNNPEVVDLEAKVAELNDRYLRLQAEFDNYRKRTLKERMDLMKTAGDDILSGFLPILDNIERASKATENVADVQAVKDGIDIIFNELYNFLKQNGVTEIKSENEVFNTDVHSAVSKFPVSEESKKGKVIDVVRKGYTLHDKVIRFAEVIVGE